jgi:hypothetical protein
LLENYLSKGDFVRILRRGPGSLKETLWLYLYREGLVEVPLSYHLAFFEVDVGTPLVRALGWAVDLLTRLLAGKL